MTTWTSSLLVLALATNAFFGSMSLATAEIAVSIRQLTSGPEHHFFGYIGHVQNIPWSGDGRYIVALRTTVPGPDAQAR